MQKYVFRTEGTSLAEPKVFYELALNNPDYQWERDNKGNIIFMTPTFSISGKYNNAIALQLNLWNKIKKEGIVFDSSTGFTLADGSIVSPDVSWIKKERWKSLTYQQRTQEFSPIAPDFVIELISLSDNLKDLQQKMEAYIQNGVQLGWLIDMDDEKIYIYKPDNDVYVVESFIGKLSGEPILQGFELDLNELKATKEEEME